LSSTFNNHPTSAPIETVIETVSETVSDASQVARAKIPGKNGITRIAAIIYVTADANWSQKIFSADLGGVTVE